MLTPDQAQQRLKTHQVANVQQYWLEHIAPLSDDSLADSLTTLPENYIENGVPISNSMRQIAYGLIRHDRDGNRIQRTTQVNIERGNLVYYASLSALSLLQSGERQSIFQIFFPKTYIQVEQLWQFIPQMPYQTGYMRKAFRAPNHAELYLWQREQFFNLLLHYTAQYHEDIVWFAEHAAYLNYGYAAHSLGRLFAAVIDAGGEIGDAVFNTLLASARGEHEVGAMGRHVIQALLIASRTDGWDFAEKMLLAAQREEGLRQIILEVIDEAHPEVFRRFLRVIIQHELSRFSAVTRAVNVWFGFAWDSESVRIINRTLEQIHTLLENEQARTEALVSGNGESVYLALWSLAFDDVFKAIDAALPLLNDPDVERRYAAVLLLTLLNVPAAQQALVTAMRDPDLRIALTACYAINDGRKHTSSFEEIEALIARLPKNKNDRSLGTLIWEWRQITFHRAHIFGMLIPTLEDRSPKRLLPYMNDFDSYHRAQAAEKLAKLGLDDPEVRDVIIKLVGDRDTYVRQQVLRLLASVTIQPQESLYLESLLLRKADDLRRAVLTLLTSQTEDSALASADRLTNSRKLEQRLAGLELLYLLKEKDKAPAECHARALHYQKARAEISTAEKNLIRSITVVEENLTLDNALGLMNPENRTPPTKPQKREVRLTSKAALASLYSLDALIHEHRTDPIFVRTWQGENQELLLGNANYNFPQASIKEKIDDEITRLPLRELWEQWVESRPAEMLDDDGLELWRARLQLEKFESETNQRWLEELEVEDKTQIKLSYRYVIGSLLGWFVRLYPAPNTSDFLLDALENAWAEMPEESLQLKRTKHGHLDWRTSDSAARAYLTLTQAQRNINGSDWEDRHAVRFWGLMRWLDEGIPNLPRLRPNIEVALAAFRLGAATEDDLYDLLLGARPQRENGYYNARFSDLRRLSTRKPHPFFEQYPALKTIYERCRERILEVELQRGEMPNVATAPAADLQSVPGMDWFLRILQGLGDQEIKRDRGSNSRTASLSHLAYGCFPTEQDTIEQFVKKVKAAKIPERLLVEAAVYAPLWAAYIERALGWKGFAEAVWWLHAHTKDSGWGMNQEAKDEWTASVNPRTPLSARDLLEGAVDVDWFWRIYKALGEKRWEMLYKAAKYSSSGSGHTRAKLFADAMLNKLNRDELVKRIMGKRHQDSVRALGLLPLPKKGRDKAILERYQTMQTFIRTSRKFGPQRRESEKLAVQIGMENLARTANYPDPARLSWAMEAREVSDLRAGVIHTTVQDVTMSLRINELGKPQVSIERGGKTLKSLPAKLKKAPEFVALRDRKSQIDKQYSRMRESLETAMCRADGFTSAELVTLLEHPVLAPMLEQLVFVGDSVIGYPVEEGRALLHHNGSIINLSPDTSLRIAHPYDLYESGEWHLWQRDCFIAERIQPFKQVFRELYLLTDAERQEGAISRRYAGHQVQPRQAIALLGSRGWIAHQYYGVQKTFHRQGMGVHLSFLGGYFTPAEVEGLTLEGVLFSKSGHLGPLQLADVPPILFSEVMRDLDLVVSVAHRGGIDPETTASTVEMRTALIRETCTLLKISNVTLQSRHALIEGKLGSYSIHLGSALVHRQPGGALCIIPVHAQHRGRIFLPFADDDPRTAEVISKVILLAKDSEIKDPSILEQIFAKG